MTLITSYNLGLIFILLDCIIWAGASVLMQHVYGEMDFRSPFFLTFLTNSLLLVYLPLWYLVPTSECRQDEYRSTDYFQRLEEQECIVTPIGLGSTAPTPANVVHYGAIPSGEQRVPHGKCDTKGAKQGLGGPKFTHADVIKVALLLAPLYVLSNGCYNYSIFMTSISSSTIISNLSGAFAFVSSWRLGMEEVSLGKLLGIIACFAGAVCVGMSDASDDAGEGGANTTATGDLIALGAALGYGLYTAVLKYLVPDDDGMPMHLLLGYIGLVNVIALAPVMVVMYWASAAQLANLTWTVFGYMCISGLFNNVISDYLWARSVVLTSSTVATVGLSVTIPLAMVADYSIQGQSPSPLSATGAGLVLVGFCLVNIAKETEVDIWGHWLRLFSRIQE